MTPQVNGLPRLFSSKPREDFGQQHHLSHPIIQDGACSPESPTSWTSGMTVNAAAAQEFCAGKQARLMTSSRKKRVFSPTFVMQWSFPTMQENVALDHYSIIFVCLNLLLKDGLHLTLTKIKCSCIARIFFQFGGLNFTVSTLWTPIYKQNLAFIRDPF